MHTRTYAATTALLLTASAAGVALAGGSAQAVGSHHTTTKAATSLTVKITSKKSGPVLSKDKIRPGKTMFKVVRGNTGGSMQLLRLKAGYSLKHAISDFGKAFGPTTNVRAVRRIDRSVVFYGGIPVPAKGDKPNWWGVDVDARDTYFVLNIDKNTLAPLLVKGKHQKRSLPTATGFVNMASAAGGANVFTTPATDPNRGWMRSTNNAAEPHFIILDKVDEATTDQDVADAFMSPDPPTFFLGQSINAEVISPGHTFVWKYHTSKGKYLATCFWPSKVDGTPHAIMGMFKLFHLA